MNVLRVLAPLIGAAALLVTMGACNTGLGDCPAKETIQPGGSCSDNLLQCPYDLMTASFACDGTSTVINTSCTCTKGTWSCPSPAACDGGAMGADGSGGGDDGGDGGAQGE
jgi:hypothetical protein